MSEQASSVPRTSVSSKALLRIRNVDSLFPSQSLLFVNCIPQSHSQSHQSKTQQIPTAVIWSEASFARLSSVAWQAVHAKGAAARAPVRRTDAPAVSTGAFGVSTASIFSSRLSPAQSGPDSRDPSNLLALHMQLLQTAPFPIGRSYISLQRFCCQPSCTPLLI